MAINWFEGGRRITTLLQALVGLAGAAYVFLGNSEGVTFQVSRPDENFALTYEKCDFPDQIRSFGPVEIEPGTSRYVRLCFRTSRQGLIAYRRGPDAVVVRLNVLPRAGTPPTARGIAPRPPTRSYYYVDPHSYAATEYMERRLYIFRQADTYRAVASRHLNALEMWGYWSRFTEALPFVLGFVFGLWILSSIIGWIIRGFSGIRSGSDFRDQPSP